MFGRILEELAERPITSMGSVVLGAGAVGVGLNSIMHPVDTAGTAITTGVGVAQHPVAAAGIGAAAVGATALTMAVGNAVARNAGKSANVLVSGTIGTGKVIGAIPELAVSGTSMLATGTVKLGSDAWTKAGWKTAAGGIAGVGAMYGAARVGVMAAFGDNSYESAMARSTEGSAYESGPSSFGQRNNRAKTLSGSVTGLVQGLHRGR